MEITRDALVSCTPAAFKLLSLQEETLKRRDRLGPRECLTRVVSLRELGRRSLVMVQQLGCSVSTLNGYDECGEAISNSKKSL